MTWLSILKGSSRADEGKALAKRQREVAVQQREVADAILESSTELAAESRHALYANHFAESIRHAMKGE